MNDFVRTEGMVQAQVSGINQGWPNTNLTPAMEAETTPQFFNPSPTLLPTFINTPLQQPSVSRLYPVQTFMTVVPSAPPSNPLYTTASRATEKPTSNPYFVNPRLYRFTIPRGQYYNNDGVKQFLRFFNELPHSKKLIINNFIGFQFEKVTEKLINQHNKEIEALRKEIVTLKEKLDEKANIDDLENNKELLTVNAQNPIIPWDLVSIHKLIDDDLTEIGDLITELGDIEEEETPAGCPKKSPHLPLEKLGEVSLRAATNKGFAKVRVKKMPGFGDSIIQEVCRLNALPFLTKDENRESGTSFHFLAGLIQKSNPNISFDPLVLTKTDVMKAFSKFKALQRRAQ